MFRFSAALLSLVLLLFTDAANADAWQDNWNKCAGPNAEVGIPACTSLIQSGQETTNNLATAYYDRGWHYNKQKSYQNAIDNFSQALALKPSMTSALENRGFAYIDLGKPDEAIADFDKALAVLPRKASLFSARAEAYTDKKDYDSAIADLTQAIRLDPGKSYYFASRGLAYQMKEDDEHAAADYKQALALDPGNMAAAIGQSFISLAIFDKGEAKREAGDYEGAIADYKRMDGDAEPSGMSMTGIGLVYAAQGDTAKANEQFDAAIKIYDGWIAKDAKAGYAYSSRGETYLAKGEFEKALADYNSAIALDAQSPGFFFNRGRAYLRMQNLEKALADFNKAIELGDSGADVMINRAELYSRMHEYEKAIADDDAALKRSPTSAKAYISRCRDRMISDQLADALSDCSAALRLAPEHLLGLGMRGLVFIKMKSYAPALIDFDDVLKRNPRDADALTGRGIAKSYAGDDAGADADLAAAEKLDPGIAKRFEDWGLRRKPGFLASIKSYIAAASCKVGISSACAN